MCDRIVEGKFVTEKGIVEACVCILDGRVADVELGSCTRLRGSDKLVFGGKGVLVYPGFIDIHVHLRGLELSYKEDEFSGTAAAAAGGFTLVIDMPNTRPEVRSFDIVVRKLASLRRNSLVDYGLYAGLPHSHNEVTKIASSRLIVGFKVYPEDLNLETLETVLLEALRYNLLVVLHPEHPDMISEECRPGERWKCRPVEAEVEAVRYISRFVPRGLRLHITHVTSARTVDVAKSSGFTVDVTPHHILLDASAEEEHGCVAKVNPPLRPRQVVEELLLKLVAGDIDAIASDHAPHAIEEKLSDFDACPPGIPGLETTARLVLTLASKGVIDYADVARLLSWGPARILGLQRYGCIEPGCIASYTVVDVHRESRVTGSMFYSKAKLTPFEMWRCRGEPIATIVRGELVYHDGCLCVKPGFGLNIAGWLYASNTRGEHSWA